MTDKLRSRAGETIAETLVALLIATLSIVMVTGAVVTAARINKKTAEQDIDFEVPSGASADSPKTSVTLTIDSKGVDDVKEEGVPDDVKITIKSTDNGYHYYEYKYVEPAGSGAGTGTGTDG